MLRFVTLDRYQEKKGIKKNKQSPKKTKLRQLIKLKISKATRFWRTNKRREKKYCKQASVAKHEPA